MNLAFGHERGFTGAATRRKGKSEQANGRPFVLDEFGAMSATCGKLSAPMEEED